MVKATQVSRRFIGHKLIAATRLARWERQIAHAAQSVLDQRREHAVALTRQAGVIVAALDPSLFDEATWAHDLHSALDPVAQRIFVEIRQGLAAKFLTRPGDLPVIPVEARVQRLVGKMQDLGPDTVTSLGRALQQGTNLGEGIDKLASRVQSVFDSSDSRAETIARTEVVGASNGVADDYAGAIHDAMPLEKSWLSAGDDRVRPSHEDADGQTVSYDDTFDVGGSQLQYPGDPDGDDEETINCRCTATYDVAGSAQETDAASAEDG